VALSGLEFDGYAPASLNGRPAAYLAVHLAYYLHDRYTALDLSRCEGDSITGYVNTPSNPHSHLSRVVSVIFPDTTEQIGARFFQSNTVLKEVTLPEGLINIGSYAFYGCASLRSVNFPSTLKKSVIRFFGVPVLRAWSSTRGLRKSAISCFPTAHPAATI